MESSATQGRKETEGKARWDLLPWRPIEEIVKVYTLGVRKYDDWNWYKGLPTCTMFGACLRHIMAYWIRGEVWNVEEVKGERTTTHHLASACFYLLAFMQFDFEGRTAAMENRPWLVRAARKEDDIARQCTERTDSRG